MFSTTALPILPGVLEAPIMATDWGLIRDIETTHVVTAPSSSIYCTKKDHQA